MNRRKTDTLWGGPARLDVELDRYTVGEDRELDQRLVVWDVIGTMGHVVGLASIGVLSAAERRRLLAALRRALDEARAGRLNVTEQDEDVHTTVEKYLTKRLGKLGGKVHTGRSRNDQVLVDLRLWMKDRLLQLSDSVLDCAAALAGWARRHERVLWPGYTHGRRAMPSTAGLWAGGFAEALLDDMVAVDAVWTLVDRSPLGSAAGYGVPLPLDRELVARTLGFASVQQNVTAVQSSRGKLETMALSAAWSVAFDLGKLAWDVILFSAPEYGFLVLPPGLATGSSIMPHKKNPDVFELTRAKASFVEGLVAQSMALSGKLPSGYHRDLQLIKSPLMRGLDETLAMARMTTRAVDGLAVDREGCARAVSGDLLATDEVFRKVRSGVPFREAYRETAAEAARGSGWASPRAEELLAARIHSGGAGRPGLARLGRRIAAAKRVVSRRREKFHVALRELTARRWPTQPRGRGR